MKIYTDHKWKQLQYRYEVPPKVLKDYFGHLTEDDSDGYIYYRKQWYHVSDFMRVEGDVFPKEWDGYSSDTYFSGILIRLSEDGETYQIGTYYS